MQFALVKKGYDPHAVDEYIAVKQQECKDKLETAKQRNALLSEQIEDLERELSAMRRNESQVTQLLVEARRMLAEAETTAHNYAEEEQSRLTQFRDKWVDYATTYLHTTLDDFAQRLTTYRDEYTRRVSERLSTNLFLLADPLYAEYRSEEARTATYSDAPVHIEELLEKLQKK